MPAPRITNEQIMDRLGEVVEALSRQPPPETSWQGFREEMRLAMAEMSAKMEMLATAQEQHGALCPYRDDIRRGANNIKRMDEMGAAIKAQCEGPRGLNALWDAVWGLRLDAAKWGMIGGGGMGGVGLIAYTIGKAAKWWP